MNAKMFVIKCLMLITFASMAIGATLRLPEKPTDHAKVARELIHKAQWTPMGTISTIKEYIGFPMVAVIAVADSFKGGKSTGDIYFYLTDLDFTGKDLRSKNVITALFSEDQDLSCTNVGMDPMEPTCARAMVFGTKEELTEGTEEYNFAKEAFISRHPAAPHWIETHHFYLCKLKIQEIILFDWYGGPHHITPAEYYNVVLE